MSPDRDGPDGLPFPWPARFPVVLFTFVVAVVIVLLFRPRARAPSTDAPTKRRSSARTSLTAGPNNPYGTPGPDKTHPQLGNLGDVMAAGGLHQYLAALHAKHGHITCFWFGETPVVSVASPDHLRATLQMYDRPEPLFALLRPLLGEFSLQFANGDDWRERRKRLDPAFAHGAIGGMLPVFCEIVEKRMQDWQSMYAAPDKGEGALIIPAHSESFEMAIRAILITAFGRASCGTDEEILALRRAYDTAWHEMEMRLDGNIPKEGSERQRKFDASLKVLQDKVDALVVEFDEAQMALGEGLLLGALIGGNYEPRQIQNDAITYLVGGFHTTGNFLTWMLYYIAKYPDVQRRIHTEIDAVFAQTADEPLEDVFTNDTLARLVYIDRVMSETLRHRIIAPWAARTVPEDGDGVWLGGYDLPPGTFIIHALGVILHDPEQFPDPERFDPDRFATKDKSRDPLAFAPFGIGRRVCPGQRFALTESKLFLAAIMRKYRIQLADDKEVVPQYGLVVSPAEEVRMVLTVRR